MAICIVIPTINGGKGWGSGSTPAHLRPARIFYRRFDPKFGTKYNFKWYVDELKNAKNEMERDGHTWYVYGYEQDGYYQEIE